LRLGKNLPIADRCNRLTLFNTLISTKLLLTLHPNQRNVRMNKLLLVVLFAVVAGLGFHPLSPKNGKVSPKTKQVDSLPRSSELSETEKLYDSLHLKSLLNYEAFEQAMVGYRTLHAKNKEILTV